MAEQRYLTGDAKQPIIREWEVKKLSERPSDDPGGHGYPDPEIYGLCDVLNAIPGVCTLQSCSGHGMVGGHLWLWLSIDLSDQFNHWAHVLARMEGIEFVQRKYTEWGQEITAIKFDGRFEEASNSIVVFFQALNDYLVQFPSRSLERHSLSSSPVVGRLDPEVVTES